MPATMNSPDVKLAGNDRREPAISTIALAFANDPVARWVFPNSLQYLRCFPEVLQAFGAHSFANGTAFCLEDDSAAALWLAPGIKPHEQRLMSIIQQAVPASRMDEVTAVLEQMDSSHPREPHWYLPAIGVDPRCQGQGRGSILLRHTLEMIDRESAPAYRESSNPLNLPLYQRHGFEIIGTIQAGSSPEFYPMLRRSR